MFINFKDEPWDMKTKIAATILTLVVVISVAIQYMNWQKGADSAATDNIILGGAFGLSGSCAEWGEGEKKAAQMAVDEINTAGGIGGKTIDFVIEDTQCEAKTVVAAINKLVNVDKVVAVIGPTWGDSYQSGWPILRAAKVPGISPSTSMEALESSNEPIDYVFSTYPPQRPEIAAIQSYAQSKGMKTVVIISDQDAYSTMMVRLFNEAAGTRDLSIIDRHEMPTGNQDFRTVLARTKEKKPDAIFISLLSPSTKGSFLKQARELGVTSVILSAADVQDPSVLKYFGSFMDGVIYTYPKTAVGNTEFMDAHIAKYGSEPQGPAAANAYDAVRMVAEAVRQGALTGEEINTKLTSISLKGLFIDTLRFDAKHQIGGGEFEVKTIRDGKFTTL